MVPCSLGCGSAVFAAMAILAPSRAARSAIARPMPREAPVMNRVLPASDIAVSLLARQESGKCRARLVRLQTILEIRHFGIDLPDHSVKMAAQQPARHRDRADRKGCDLLRRLQRNGIDRGGIDHFVDDAGFSRLLG